MKLRPAIVFACFLALFIAGCAYITHPEGRLTPPASGLAVTRPDRPAGTQQGEPTLCALTPAADDTPCAASDPYPVALAPAGTSAEAAASVDGGYPGPTTPSALPPATVVIPSIVPSEPTAEAPLGTPPATAIPTSAPTSGPTPSPRPPAPTPADPVERAVLAAVKVQVPMGDGTLVSEGLGVSVASTGRIIAPLHVLYDGATGAWYDPEGEATAHSYDASGSVAASAPTTLEAWDAGRDLAVLSTPRDARSHIAAASIGDASAAGLPMHAKLRLVLLAPDDARDIRIMDTQVEGRAEDESGAWILANATLSSGAVGGGVALNASGQVVGLLQAEGGLAPGQTIRIRPIEAASALLAHDAPTEALPETVAPVDEEQALRILYRGAEGVNLRSQPATSASIVARLHRDEVYPVIAPNDDEGWHPVYAGGGRVGWVALRHPTGTRLAEPQTLAYAPALSVGGTAEVACLADAPGEGCANLRAGAGWRTKPADDVLARLPAGATVEVLAGPTQVDGLAWWQVRDARSGAEGWIAEVTASGYRVLVVGAK